MMASKKNIHDLKAHVAQFAPEYPVKKGYAAQLLLDRTNTPVDVMRKIQSLVLVAEPDKRINESCLLSALKRFNVKLTKHLKSMSNKDWSILMNFLPEQFPISFISKLTSDDLQHHSTQIHSSPLSCTFNMQPCFSGTLNRSPSPKKMRYDCDACAKKKRTVANMTKKCESLSRKLKAIRKVNQDIKATYSVKRTNQTKKRNAIRICALRKRCKDLEVSQSVFQDSVAKWKDVEKKLTDAEALIRQKDQLLEKAMKHAQVLEKKLMEAEGLNKELAQYIRKNSTFQQ